ncbi:MAG: hypothetical protein ACLSHU_05325 [Oscillospiraceae bacterium]
MALINHKDQPGFGYHVFNCGAPNTCTSAPAPSGELALARDVELQDFSAGRDYTGLQKTHTSHENTRRNDPCKDNGIEELITKPYDMVR